MRTTVILGAGFSKSAGVPVQSEIPGIMVSGEGDNAFGHAVSKILRRFIRDVFGFEGGSAYPSLDDIFTCIDVSTNSGHHLGIGYTPMHLRAIRRLVIYSLFSILSGYVISDDIERLLGNVYNRYDSVNFVVLNWDTVLESHLASMFPAVYIDYCNSGREWENSIADSGKKPIKAAKVHGSSNWLYCDNCRTLFYDMNDSVTAYQRAGFQKSDIEIFGELARAGDPKKFLNTTKCKVCGDPVSSHIATFSYRKSFRANSFPDIWNEAERMLSTSDRWIFIGYSFPEADYEFKHMLKISELKLQHTRSGRLGIDVILLDDSAAALRYKGFFGKNVNIICNGGIREYLKYYR